MTAFNKYQHILDTRVINRIYNDLIEIKTNSQDKEAYRKYLISERIDKIEASWALTKKAIDRLIFELHYSEISAYELCKTYKKVSSSIQSYHKELVKLFNQLEGK